MEISAIWSKPVRLTIGSKKNLIFYFPIEAIAEKSGCYVFYNKHGKSYSILYIGQTDNLKKRLEQQQNNVKLMMGIKNRNGKKHLVYCEVIPKQGQNLKKILNKVE